MSYQHKLNGIYIFHWMLLTVSRNIIS